MFNNLFHIWLKGIKIIIPFIIAAIGVIILHFMLFAAFDLITFSMFGDMMFAKTLLPEKIYEKLYKYLSENKGE